MKAFSALESLGKDPFSIGKIPPTPGLVDQFFNDSTGEGEPSEDCRGPWNQGNGWQFVEAPAFRDLQKTLRETSVTSSRPRNPKTEPAVPRTAVDGMPNNNGRDSVEFLVALQHGIDPPSGSVLAYELLG